jgi:hypothetical protein
MTTRPITDQQVAALPVHGGRAELLEEIMSTPVDRVDHVDHSPEARTPRRKVRTWTAVAAAAAVVATVGGLAALRLPHESGAADGSDRAASTSGGERSRTVPPVPGGAYVALDQPGWQVASVFEDPHGLDLVYQQGDAVLDLTTYPAAEYQSDVDDRDADAGGSQNLTLLGRPAQLWAYAADDHAVIRSAEGDRFLEVRGSGMSDGEFQVALADLVQTDARGFAGSLPSDVVTPYHHDEAIRHLLQGVDTPPGFTAGDVRLHGFNDAYQSSAQVAGSVGCAWLHVWDGGSAADRDAVIAAFDSSRTWPLLVAIRDQGGYAQGFWTVADQLRAGHSDKGEPLDIDALTSSICS